MNKRLRVLSVLGVALMLSGCGREQEIDESEFNRLMFNGMKEYTVEGEPFTGTLLYREGDTLRARIEMRDGNAHGELELFHENGERAVFGYSHWDDEKKRVVEDGTSERWDKEGNLLERKTSDEGELELVEAWCDDGGDKSRREYEDGKRRREQTWDCDTGKLVQDQNFNAEGQTHGDHKTWTPDGQPQSHSRYANGQREGLQESWHPGGQQAYRGEFSAGKEVGKHETWNAEGRLVEAGMYGEPGQKTGLWLERSGEQERAVHYGPDGFIKPTLAQAYARVLAGESASAESVAFYLDEGQVGVNDALPTTMNGMVADRSFEFPMVRWTYAVIVAGPEVLPVLLEKGADINQADSEGRTRLMLCAQRFKAPEIARFHAGCLPDALSDTLAKGGDAKARTREGRNALHLIVSGAGTEDRGIFGRQAAAALQARSEAIAQLAKAGADPNAVDAKGYSPLVIALKERRGDLARALVAAGARGDSAGPNGTRAVHWLALNEPNSYRLDSRFVADMLPVLAAAGADMNATMDWDGEKVSLRDLLVRHGMVDLARQIGARSGD